MRKTRLHSPFGKILVGIRKVGWGTKENKLVQINMSLRKTKTKGNISLLERDRHCTTLLIPSRFNVRRTTKAEASCCAVHNMKYSEIFEENDKTTRY